MPAPVRKEPMIRFPLQLPASMRDAIIEVAGWGNSAAWIRELIDRELERIKREKEG